MTDLRRSRALAATLGVLGLLAAAVLAETVCGVLLRRRGPRPVPVAPPLNNRLLLSPHRTRAGFFPEPPRSGPTARNPAPRRRPLPEGSRLAERPLDADSAERLKPRHHWRRVGPMGLKLPCSSYRSLRTLDSGEVVWDRIYDIEPSCRRRTPGEAAKRVAPRFVVLLGDSTIFGEGLADDETLAAYLGRELPRRRVYNYAVPGAFPGELMDRARLIRRAELTEPRGTVYYFYADYHVLRNMGSFTTLDEWGSQKPRYAEAPDGRIVRGRSFAAALPVRTFLLSRLRRSNIVRYLSLEVTPREKDWRFELRLIEETRRAAEAFGADRFFVVFPPRRADTAARMVPLLEGAGIRYIDFSHWRNHPLTRGPWKIAKESHPTAEYNRVFARALAAAARRVDGE